MTHTHESSTSAAAPKLTTNIPGASRDTGIGQKTLRDAVASGRLKAIKVGRRGKIVIPLWALEEFLRSEAA
jgi:Helix-turn-helix domain